MKDSDRKTSALKIKQKVNPLNKMMFLL